MVSQTPFVPPDLRAAVERLEEEFLPNAPKWFRSRGLAADLDAWVNLGKDLASFWGFADDYINELGCRDRLVVWMGRSDGVVRQWLVGEVDRADELFRSNSAPRSVDASPTICWSRVRGGGASCPQIRSSPLRWSRYRAERQSR